MDHSIKQRPSSFTSNPVLDSLAEATTAAVAGATLGSVVDTITEDTNRTFASVGACLGLTLAVVGQLSRL